MNYKHIITDQYTFYELFKIFHIYQFLISTIKIHVIKIMAFIYKQAIFKEHNFYCITYQLIMDF
jgi:hypothetical protein